MNLKSWSSKQRRFLHLLSHGVSIEKITDELKVNQRRLTRWKSLPGFKEALEGACRELILEETPRFLRALTEKAKKGDIQAIKILFDYMGQIGAGSETDLGEFKEEERQRLKEALIREIARLNEAAKEKTTARRPARRDRGMG